MTRTATEGTILEALADLRVIDAHEHLVPEAFRTSAKVDFGVLFCNYAAITLRSAGMSPADVATVVDFWSDVPIEKKWELFGRFYPAIEHTTAVRPAKIWLREQLGVDNITADNYREVSERLQAGNTPGLYGRTAPGSGCRKPRTPGSRPS